MINKEIKNHCSYIFVYNFIRIFINTKPPMLNHHGKKTSIWNKKFNQFI